MNEQEFLHHIKEQTEQTPIPDSISPENMKKLLDDRLANPTSDTDNTTEKNTGKSKAKKWTIQLAVASVALCLCGGIGFSIFHLKPSKNTTSDSESIAYTETQEDVQEAAETQDEATQKDTLAYATTMDSPVSYDAYYNTIKSAYDDYYNQFATVETEDDLLLDGEYEMSEDIQKGVAPEASATFLNKELADLSSTADARAPKDYSTTNTQEAMIDEGDIIKTDGHYIYKASGAYNEELDTFVNTLSITKAENGKLSLMSTIDLDAIFPKEEGTYAYFHEMYLYKNNLLLIFEKIDETTETAIVIYDVRDKENPVQKKILRQSGGYESSRISDGYLYTVSNFTHMDYSTRKPYSNYVPSINDDLIDCNNIYYPEDAFVQTTYVVTSTDLQSFTITDSKAVPTNGGGLYVSGSSLYIYGTIYDEVTKTEVLRIGYEDGTLTVGKSAIFTGFLYDTFALSEHNGFLRVVATIPANNISILRKTGVIEDAEKSDNKTDEKTTEQDVPTEDINVLYIFDKNMELTGKISGIAPGEQIRSARFLGDMGYLVTFENVDPLFSMDLSDPYNPEIVGRLSIPGFSEYLHSYADGLLLGIGQEIEPTTQEFMGLKLSMFDISNPEDVTVLDQSIIREAYYSPAEYNHKALMIDTKKNIFGFMYQESTTDAKGIYTTNNYYVTYSYDKEDGFVETGKYKLDMKDYDVDGIRSVYIGNYLYIATQRDIVSYEIGTDNQIDKLSLQ